MAEQDLNGYLSQLSPVDYTAPEGMKKPGDAGIFGNILDALSVALNPENPSAPYNMAMQRQAQLKQDKVGYLSGIATDFLSKNPGADPAVVASILKKTAPDVYDQVDKAEVFNAIQKSIEPIVKFNEDDFKNAEYAAAKDFNAFNTDRPVYAVVGGTAQLNPMYEKVGKSYWKKWMAEKGYKLQGQPNQTVAVTTKDGYKLSKEQLDEISKQAENVGVNPNHILKAFDFSRGADYGQEEMSESEKIAWARLNKDSEDKLMKPGEAEKRVREMWAIDEGYTFRTKDTNEAWGDLAKAFMEWNNDPQNKAKEEAYRQASLPFTSLSAQKVSKKDDAAEIKRDYDVRKLEFNKQADLIAKDKRIKTQQEKNEKIRLLRETMFPELFGELSGTSVPGKKSDDKPGKWEEQ